MGTIITWFFGELEKVKENERKHKENAIKMLDRYLKPLFLPHVKL